MDISTHLKQVEETGYTCLEQPFALAIIDALEEAVLRVAQEMDSKPGRNAFHGHETVRVKGLINRGEVFEQFMIQPTLIAMVEALLGRDVQLGSTQAVIIGPGESPQALHPDRGHPPLALLGEASHAPLRTSLGVMLALTDFTKDNGATRVVLGSHRACTLAESEVSDAVSVEIKRGDLLIWDANLWHGGGANQTDTRRIGLLTYWVAGWVRPDDNLLLLIPREKISRFPRRLQELVGFRAYQGSSGLVAGYDPMIVLDPGGTFSEYSQQELVYAQKEKVYSEKETVTTELFERDG